MTELRLRLLLAATALVIAVGESNAQTAADLGAACSSGGGDATLCAAASLAGRDLLGHMGVLSGVGADVPGESSTLGRRLGGMPRIAVYLRGSARSVGLPDIADASGSGRIAPFVPSAQVGVALGLYDGFRVLPTVGGVLSFDVIAQAGFMFFPEREGFAGRTGSLSYGARVGVFQESFTLPGVSVSVMRRVAGGLQLGDTSVGDPAQLTVDPTITSLRATVGKDLFAVGVMAGIGWEDYSSLVPITVTNGSGGFASVSGELDESRSLFFLGASKQIGILAWISAELGFVRAFEPVPSFAGLVPQPDDLGVFGSVAVLLKL